MSVNHGILATINRIANQRKPVILYRRRDYVPTWLYKLVFAWKVNWAKRYVRVEVDDAKRKEAMRKRISPWFGGSA